MAAAVNTLAAVAAWFGLALVIDGTRWGARRRLAERLRPYSLGAMGRVSRPPPTHGLAELREIVQPLLVRVTEAAAKVGGSSTPLETRLRQVHAPVSPTDFRLRQASWMVVAGGIGVAGGIVVVAPAAVIAGMGVAAALLGFLLVEQQLAAAAARRQTLIRRELPIVAEQLGMLTAAGYGLVRAIERIALRSSGATSQDLRVIVGRVSQGVDVHRALREWADRVQVDAVFRLVAVLDLEKVSGDLPPLIAAEARALRRDLHRDLLADLERRAQQVWIPVTVATLLPGALLIGVPFSAALSGFLTT